MQILDTLMEGKWIFEPQPGLFVAAEFRPDLMAQVEEYEESLRDAAAAPPDPGVPIGEAVVVDIPDSVVATYGSSKADEGSVEEMNDEEWATFNEQVDAWQAAEQGGDGAPDDDPEPVQ